MKDRKKERQLEINELKKKHVVEKLGLERNQALENFEELETVIATIVTMTAMMKLQCIEHLITKKNEVLAAAKGLTELAEEYFGTEKIFYDLDTLAEGLERRIEECKKKLELN